MTDTQLFIPNKLKIGYQTRNDTYTGKLAYVIYFDQNGKLRKEKSWESWRHKSIDPIEIINEPTEGFVLNKNVGGYKSDWNYRNAHIRVYDPRDFEFEISLENLLFILRDCDCSKGKGLEGKFIYAWDGTELVLLPINSENYKNSKEYTELQVKSIKSKDLIEGASYLTKKQAALIYIGRRICYPNRFDCYGKVYKEEQKYVFWDHLEESWIFLKDLKNLASCITDTIVSNYAQLVVNFEKSIYGSKIIGLKVVETDFEDKKDFYKRFVVEKDGIYLLCKEVQHLNWGSQHPYSVIQIVEKIKWNNGIEVVDFNTPHKMYPPDYPKIYKYSDTYEYPLRKDYDVGFYFAPRKTRLIAILESGSEYAYLSYYSELSDSKDYSIDEQEIKNDDN